MNPILEVKDIVKVYPNGVVANRGVSLKVEPGTIHALVGENGAGKSTLMKIVFGLERPDEGEIYFKGKKVKIFDSHEAIKLGIGMVHQHLMLAPDLTVAENLFLGIEPRKGVFLDIKKTLKSAEDASKYYSLSVPSRLKIKDLPIGVQQRVEILKALVREVELLILDEPTSILTPQETEVLFETLKGLKKIGKTIVFISHKLKEVKAVADLVTVMRDGKVVATQMVENTTEKDMAYLMVGRDLSFEKVEQSLKVGESSLIVKDLSYMNLERRPVLNKINFELKKGEILGIAGIEGNGQTELAEIITGLRTSSYGEIIFKGDNILGHLPRKIREKGVAHIPEDRMKHGAALDISTQENLIVDRYQKKPFSNILFLNWKNINQYAKELIKSFSIATPNAHARVGSLSGGNIQRVVVARELSSSPELIIADQPTMGIDVSATDTVHRLLIEFRNKGAAILLISADLEEVLKLSTRILVIYSGEIVGEFVNTPDLNGKDLGPYMLGIKKKEVM